MVPSNFSQCFYTKKLSKMFSMFLHENRHPKIFQGFKPKMATKLFFQTFCTKMTTKDFFDFFNLRLPLKTHCIYYIYNLFFQKVYWLFTSFFQFFITKTLLICINLYAYFQSSHFVTKALRLSQYGGLVRAFFWLSYCIFIYLRLWSNFFENKNG